MSKGKYGSNGNPLHPSQVYRQSAYRSPQNEKRASGNMANGGIERSAQVSSKKFLIKNAKSPPNQETMKLIQNNAKSTGMFKMQKNAKNMESQRYDSKENPQRKQTGQSKATTSTNNRQSGIRTEREPGPSSKIPRLHRNNAEVLANRLAGVDAGGQQLPTATNPSASMLQQYNQQKASNHQHTTISPN